MDKEEFLKTTSRIICNEGCGKLAKKVIAALKAELGEPLAADVREFDFGTACEVSIRGHEGCFGYRSRLEDGTHSSRTPEDFARYKQLALSKGFRHVASAPLARSSYRAWEALEDVHDLY